MAIKLMSSTIERKMTADATTGGVWSMAFQKVS